MKRGKTFDISRVPPPPPVEIAGTESEAISWRLISDVAHSLTAFAEDTDTTCADKTIAAIEMIRAMKPTEASEALLITQIVCAHNLATDALYQAAQPGLSEEVSAARSRKAARFMTIFRHHLQTLIAYRNTPEQRKLRLSLIEPQNMLVQFVDPMDGQLKDLFGTPDWDLEERRLERNYECNKQNIQLQKRLQIERESTLRSEDENG